MPAIHEAIAAAAPASIQTARTPAAIPDSATRQRRSPLPDQLQTAVPSCAQSCISAYITQEYGACAADDYLCLCSQYSSSGFTLGELAYGCLSISCDEQTVLQDEQDLWNICYADVDAVDSTHTISLVLPSRTLTATTSALGATTTSASTSASTQEASTTNSASQVGSTSASPTSSTSAPAAPAAAASTATSVAVSSASISSSSHPPLKLDTAQVVGISFGALGALLLIIALIYMTACLRRRKDLNAHRKYRDRDSYDFIDDAPANYSSPPGSRLADPRTQPSSFYEPKGDLSEDEKRATGHPPQKSTITPVPGSRDGSRQRQTIDPFDDHSLASPPKLAVGTNDFPASIKRNSMLLPEKPRSIGPPPPPKKARLAPLKQEVAPPSTVLFEEDNSAVIANFSRPAQPALPREIFLPSNPRMRMAQPPALARRQVPSQKTGQVASSSSSASQPLHRPQQNSARNRPSAESTRKVSLSLDIPRQANKSVSAVPSSQMVPVATAPVALRIVNKTPSPEIPREELSQLMFSTPPQDQTFRPLPSAQRSSPSLPARLPHMNRSTISTSLGTSQASPTTDNVLEYYTSPLPSDTSPTSPQSATPIEDDVQRRRAVPMAIIVTKPTYPPRAVRTSNHRISGGSDTSFESTDPDEPTPPAELEAGGQPLSPVHELQSQLHQPEHSPIAAIRYPKIPRSSNQTVPRSPVGGERVQGYAEARLSPSHTSPVRSPGLAGLIEQSQLASPRRRDNDQDNSYRQRMTPEQQQIDTSTLSGSTLAVKRRGDGQAKQFRIDTSYSHSGPSEKGGDSKSGSVGKDMDNHYHAMGSGRGLPPRESPLKGYGRVTSNGGGGGQRQIPRSGGPRSGQPLGGSGRHEFPPGPHRSSDQTARPPQKRNVPPALRIGNGDGVGARAGKGTGWEYGHGHGMPVEQEVLLKSPLWEPKLTPSRRGDDLFLSVSLASPTCR